MRVAIVAATFALSRILVAQTATEHVALGDKDFEAMNAAGALAHYQAAIAIDSSNTEALWKASVQATDLGEFNDAGRDSLYRLGEQYARRAVQSNPQSSMVHFALAKAIGRRALSLGPRDRVKYAGEVRKEALAALQLDSANAGALHVMAMWHANIMRLSGFTRFLAKNLLGGKTFSEANWNDAALMLERAVALEPERIVHRLDLAGVYRDRGEKAKARQEYEAVQRLALRDYNDKSYKAQAEREVAEIR
jgi:tetratricopeptide (TPR) repeat protein